MPFLPPIYSRTMPQNLEAQYSCGMVCHYYTQTMCITPVKQARCDHEGGRGLPGSFRVLYIYLHPPRNFFCTNVPRMGSVCAHGYARVVRYPVRMFDASIPPHPPHSMASFPRVCVCSLIAPHAGYSTALLCYCVTVLPGKVEKEVLGFYVVTKQAMKVTREILETPPQYLHTTRKDYISNGL